MSISLINPKEAARNAHRPVAPANWCQQKPCQEIKRRTLYSSTKISVNQKTQEETLSDEESKTLVDCLTRHTMFFNRLPPLLLIRLGEQRNPRLDLPVQAHQDNPQHRRENHGPERSDGVDSHGHDVARRIGICKPTYDQQRGKGQHRGHVASSLPWYMYGE